MRPTAQLETRAPLYRRMSELALFDMAVAAVVACSPSEMYKDVVFKVAMQMIGLPAVILSQSLPRGGCEWRLDALFDTAGECGRERRATHIGETHEARHPRHHKNKAHRLFVWALLWSSHASQRPAGRSAGRAFAYLISGFAQLCAIALHGARI